MKKFCILEYPAKNNLSYIFYNKYFKKLGINAIYENISFHPSHFRSSIKKILEIYLGFNLTNPFKEIILRYVKSDTVSKIIGSANCVYKNCAYNTDWIGIYNSISKELLKEPILIVGAGGVARSFIYTLQKIGCKDIYVVNRTYKRALELLKNFDNLKILKIENLFEGISNFKTLINATTIGSQGESFIVKNLSNFNYVYDVIYHTTSLQVWSKEQNIYFTSGKKMWYYQAIENLKIWNIYEKNVFDNLFREIVGRN